MTASAPPVRIGLVDMNAGVKNEAMRCLRSTLSVFEGQLRAASPDARLEVVTVSPRDKGEKVPRDVDMVISSGGPGSPYESEGTAWMADFASFLDDVVEAHEKSPTTAVGVLPICYSFELVVLHFKLAKLVKRESRKFGVMPQYMTAIGAQHPLLSMFVDRIFAFEHRNWDAVDDDVRAFASLKGSPLARESRPGKFDKGMSITALHLGPGIESTLFHPEADRPGIKAWIDKPEEEAAFREAYGDLTHERMLRTIDHPERIDRAHQEVIPGFLRRHHNRLAPSKGWTVIPDPAPTPFDDRPSFPDEKTG